jgi:hypothetical protein
VTDEWKYAWLVYIFALFGAFYDGACLCL